MDSITEPAPASNGSAKPKRKMPISPGRPSMRSDELMQLICDHVQAGKTYTQISQIPYMPQRGTLFRWQEEDKGVPAPDGSGWLRLPFRDMLKKARADRAEVWADQIIEKTDGLDNGKCSHEDINRVRLQNGVRMFFIPKDNERFAEPGAQVNVAVGVNVQLPEKQRLELLERRERALLGTPTNTST